jgi:hypothetical protein
MTASSDPYVLFYVDPPELAPVARAAPHSAAALAGYRRRSDTVWGERFPQWPCEEHVFAGIPSRDAQLRLLVMDASKVRRW